MTEFGLNKMTCLCQLSCVYCSTLRNKIILIMQCIPLMLSKTINNQTFTVFLPFVLNIKEWFIYRTVSGHQNFEVRMNTMFVFAGQNCRMHFHYFKMTIMTEHNKKSWNIHTINWVHFSLLVLVRIKKYSTTSLTISWNVDRSCSSLLTLSCL